MQAGARRDIAVVAAVVAGALLTAGPATAATVKERVFYEGTPGTLDQVFFNQGGLRLIGGCASGPQTTIRIQTTVNNASVHVGAHGAGEAYADDDNFDTGDSLDLPAAISGDGDFEAGQIVYSRPDGTHVSIDWAAQEDPIPFDQKCLFAGIAQVSVPDGVERGSRRGLDFRADAGDPRKTVLDAAGLRLRASCSPADALKVVARARRSGGAIFANTHAFGPGVAYADDKRLDASERFKLFDELGVADSTVGQLAYISPRKTLVTVDWSGEQGALGNTSDCLFGGTARVAGRKARHRAFFARKRAQSVPEPKRGIPEPDPQRFHRHGPFALLAACGTSQALEGDALFAEVESLHEGGSLRAFVSHVPGDTASSQGSSAGGGPSQLVSGTRRQLGHGVVVSEVGDIFNFDLAASERRALGKRCLLAGTTDIARAPGFP